MQKDISLGVDVGGSGIKGALVNIKTGELVSERFRLATPVPSKPKIVAKTFAKVVKHFKWNGPVGCGFPAVVKNGIATTAANIDKDWIGAPVEKIFSEASDCDVFVRNDADLAGLAEWQFGAGKKIKKGTTILITIGTGLGSALIIDGKLVPNTEFGHLYLKGHRKIAEQYAADSIRKKEDLNWKIWGKRFNQYLEHLNHIFSPNLIILGGGASKKMNKFGDQLKVKTEIIPAELLNQAGIIGGAYLGHQMKKEMSPA